MIRDDYDLQIEYHNSFIELLKGDGIDYSTVEDLGMIHAENGQLYCVFAYVDNQSGKRKWGIYGGVNQELSDGTPVMFMRYDVTGSNYETVVSARKNLKNDWNIAIIEPTG